MVSMLFLVSAWFVFSWRPYWELLYEPGEKHHSESWCDRWSWLADWTLQPLVRTVVLLAGIAILVRGASSGDAS